MTSDPTRDPGRLDDLFRVLKQMEEDIESLYVRRGVEGMRSRYVRPLIKLFHEGPVTISALAASLGATHSATSQTVAAMKRAGFVTTAPGDDGRTQMVSLTSPAIELVPLLESEWRATEAVVAALDDELEGGITALSAGLVRALARRSMGQRLDDELER